MQVEAIRGLSIEIITKDGGVQSGSVGTVNPQLMRTTCDGIQLDQSSVFLFFKYFIVCQRRLAIFVMHHLHGPIIHIQDQWQVDLTGCLIDGFFKNGDIGLVNAALKKLLLKQLMGLF